MTLRKVLAGAEADVRQRLDEVLDSEDAIVMLVDRRGLTTYAHGFAISGCQLEMVGNAIESVLRHAMAGPACAQVDVAGDDAAGMGLCATAGQP